MRSDGDTDILQSWRPVLETRWACRLRLAAAEAGAGCGGGRSGRHLVEDGPDLGGIGARVVSAVVAPGGRAVWRTVRQVLSATGMRS